MAIDDLSQFVNTVFQERAVHVDSFDFGECRISRWKNASTFPRITIAVCEGPGGPIASLDIQAFSSILAICRPQYHDLCEHKWKIGAVLPPRLGLLPIGDGEYIDRETRFQQPPHVVDGVLVFNCNDWRSGMVVRILCDNYFNVTQENVCEGVTMDLL